MTTTTRTTKGRTAKVLTALMAVFGVLVAMLMVSAPAASAHDGNHSDHGQNKITICHFVHGNGSTGEGYNIITIAERAWYHGHSDGDDDVTRNWTHDDRDVVYDGRACPTVPPATLYTATGHAGPVTVCADDTDVVVPEQTATATWGTSDAAEFATEAEAQVAANTRAQDKVDDLVPADSTPGECPTDGTLYRVTGYAGPLTVCTTDGTLVVPQQSATATWGTSEAATYETATEAQTAADNAAALKLAALVPEGATAGACVPPGTDVTRSYTVNGTADFCPVGGTETVTVTYTGSGTATKATEAEALAAAQGLAELAAKADLASKTPADVTSGACTPVTPEVVAPVEPGTVAPVEAATVAVPAAATVPVPTSAPLPATVPAGDGSSVPQLPILGWVLVVLATTALAVSAVRLAAGSTR